MINTTTTTKQTWYYQQNRINLSIFSLNWARSEATTLTSLQGALTQPNIFRMLLQEPWLTSHGTSPTCTRFDTFYQALTAKCCIYILKTTNLKPNITFTTEQSFLDINITLPNSSLTLYNFYSPGRLIAVAKLF